MSAHRCRRVDPRAAEQMLSGERAAGSRALNDLLAAAAAPARESELGGEHAAVVAFRAARLDPVPQLRRRSMIKTVLAKLLTAKIAAAAAAAAVTAAGVAAAAATGYLPAPLGGSSTVAPTSSSVSSTSANASSENHPAGTGNGDAHSTSPASPSLVGLCHAYTAGAGSEHGKALDSPAFIALITTAGGKAKVDAYCATLLASKPEEPSGTPATVTPTSTAQDHGAHGTNDPGAGHPEHPTGPPTTHPSH